MFLRDRDQRYPEPMVPSAKTTMVKETVMEWVSEAPNDKIIIFTQFLEESQIIGRMLQAEGIHFAYYYGSLPAKKRDAVIQDLHTEKEL
jgi:SNF2 family DNA or RNA helicase